MHQLRPRVRQTTRLLLLIVLLLACGCRGESTSGLTGQQAPDFTLDMLDGGSTSLKELRGKPVLLEFWAPWCSGCLKNIPPLKQLHAQFGDRIAFIAASSEQGKKTVARFAADNALPYPIGLSNQKFLDAYRVSVIPVTILIDREGVVRYHHAGQFQVELLTKKMKPLL